MYNKLRMLCFIKMNLKLLVVFSLLTLLTLDCSFAQIAESNNPINWNPEDNDWQITEAVDVFYNETIKKINPEKFDRNELLVGWAVSEIAFVKEELDKSGKKMAVEYTTKLIDNVSFNDFMQVFIVSSWGKNLDNWLGGNVDIKEHDESERVVKQVERMILSTVPLGLDFGKFDLDMTKVEVIKYEKNRVIVYWRVMYSDNSSVDADIGSLRFEKYNDSDSVLVTFNSAHLLRVPEKILVFGGKRIKNKLITGTLKSTFKRCIEHYEEIVKKGLNTRD